LIASEQIMSNNRPQTMIGAPRRKMIPMYLAIGLLAIACGGCSSVLNPAFLAMVTTASPDGAGVVDEITLNNAPGHVPVFFVNNTQYDQTLLDYLESVGVDVDRPDLRPRVRLRVTITYVNGNTNTFEFIDGSDLIQGSVPIEGGTQAVTLVPSALTSNELTNVVGICDIAEVRPEANSVEVFVPVFVKVIGFEEVGIVTAVRTLNETIPPTFVPLERDVIDGSGNVTLQQNFDQRDVPVPVVNVQCGSVVGFTLTGTLRVPFVVDELGRTTPGYLDFDTAAGAASPGRFEFQTTVR
jgi:hypothetical protein